MENAADYTRRLLKGGAKAHKALGQNFLTDDSVIQEIVTASVQDTDTPLIEIGSGLGVLTRKLVQAASKVWAVELDRAKVRLLEREMKDQPVVLLNRDALTLDLREIWGQDQGVLVGNLPYYITSPLLMHFLAQKESLQSMVVMVQREVADRLAAKPGGKDYGILSIATQVNAEVEKVMEVPPKAFFPVPKVTSAVVRLVLRPYPGFTVEEKSFFRVVKAAFSQRRKTIGNSLAAGLSQDKAKIAVLLEQAGIDSQRRAETLTIEEYHRLTEMLAVATLL